MKNFADVIAKEFTIFRTGTWNGETFTEADLDRMVDNFNEDEPPHIILGHSSDYAGKTLIPSFGRVLGGLKRVGSDLVAMGTAFNDKMADWIKEGFFNQRSVEMSKDKSRILAIGMLGATPPAVKGMDLMQNVLKETALAYSETAESLTFEFAELDQITLDAVDKVSKAAVVDTFESITECVAEFLKNIESEFSSGKDQKVIQELAYQHFWKMQDEVMQEIGLHGKFMEKMHEIMETEEYSTKSGWNEFKESVKSLFTKRKESEVDKKKEQEYQETIQRLETELKEFKDKEFAKAEEERIASEAKVKADAEKADNDLKEEIKTFCETAVKENRMTPAMRETDEPIMFDLAKADTKALKSFQEKYKVGVVPVGIVTKIDEEGVADLRPEIQKQAEKYIKSNPKQFDGLNKTDAMNRAIFLQEKGEIKFEAVK